VFKDLEDALYPVIRKRFTIDAIKVLFGFLGVGFLAIILMAVKVYHSTLEYADTNLARQVAIHFEDKHVKEILANVASTEASSLLRKEIAPTVNQFRNDVSNRVDQFQFFLSGMQGSLTNTEKKIALAQSEISDTSNQILRLDAQANNIITNFKASIEPLQLQGKELLSQLALASKEIEVLRLYLDAKQGSVPAYNALSEYSETNGSQRAVSLARSASDELWVNVDEISANGFPLVYTFFINKIARRERPPAEIIYKDLLLGGVNERIRAVNSIKERNLKYFAETLVDVVASNENWKVTVLSVSTLQQMTGKGFEVHPPCPSVEKWWQSDGKTNDMYRNPVVFLGGGVSLAAPLSPAEATNDFALTTLKHVLYVRPGLCNTRLLLAQYLIENKRRPEAEEQLRMIQEECDGRIEPGIMLAKMLVEDGKPDEASKLLHNLRPWVQDTNAFDTALRSDPDFKALTNRFGEITKE
jgi:hypothetical protein